MLHFERMGVLVDKELGGVKPGSPAVRTGELVLHESGRVEGWNRLLESHGVRAWCGRTDDQIAEDTLKSAATRRKKAAHKKKLRKKNRQEEKYHRLLLRARLF
jgi:hypothetical protein